MVQRLRPLHRARHHLRPVPPPADGHERLERVLPAHDAPAPPGSGPADHTHDAHLPAAPRSHAHHGPELHVRLLVHDDPVRIHAAGCAVHGAGPAGLHPRSQQRPGDAFLGEPILRHLAQGAVHYVRDDLQRLLAGLCEAADRESEPLVLLLFRAVCHPRDLHADPHNLRAPHQRHHAGGGQRCGAGGPGEGARDEGLGRQAHSAVHCSRHLG
mmetsp:Transcript_27716/g.86433  ORF Transcript_27716/g.86433 Transcript_27716/m.86433 type:complete len:213 (+) Transcript_27716:653-1291(+)